MLDAEKPSRPANIRETISIPMNHAPLVSSKFVFLLSSLFSSPIVPRFGFPMDPQPWVASFLSRNTKRFSTSLDHFTARTGSFLLLPLHPNPSFQTTFGFTPSPASRIYLLDSLRRPHSGGVRTLPSSNSRRLHTQRRREDTDLATGPLPPSSSFLFCLLIVHRVGSW
jgi:hypothetical protein